MDLYILDSYYIRDILFEKYSSLIWTERFSDIGDFEMVVENNEANHNLFYLGTVLELSLSDRLMVVEYVEEVESGDSDTMIVKGSSLEYILKYRANIAGTKAGVTGLPAEIMRGGFNNVCMRGLIDSRDVLPNTSLFDMYPASLIPEPAQNITLDITLESLHDYIKAIADVYNLGWRLVKNPASQAALFHFNVYSGNDRTSRQTRFPPIIFSEYAETLTKPHSILTNVDFYNAALAVTENYTGLTVLAPGEDPAASGFDRRVLPLVVDGINPQAESSLVVAALTIKAQLELNKHKQTFNFDGEIDKNAQFKYNKDYYLGDIVELQSKYGSSAYMRVTEQIFVSDAEGERQYPTLTLNSLSKANTWRTWKFDEVWSGVDNAKTWENTI